MQLKKILKLHCFGLKMDAIQVHQNCFKYIFICIAPRQSKLFTFWKKKNRKRNDKTKLWSCGKFQNVIQTSSFGKWKFFQIAPADSKIIRKYCKLKQKRIIIIIMRRRTVVQSQIILHKRKLIHERRGLDMFHQYKS